MFNNVLNEPAVQEANTWDGTHALIADISIRGGLWQPQTTALLDALFVVHHGACIVTQSQYSPQHNRRRKGNTCTMALLKHNGHSSHLFEVSNAGMLGREAQRISMKWDKPLGQIKGWLCKRLSFAILRATNLCL